MPALKVYAVKTMNVREWNVPGPEQRHARMIDVIVAASSKAKAIEAFRAAGLRNLTLHFFNNYGYITGNSDSLRVALAEPGAVFAAHDMTHDYVKVADPL